MPLFDDWCENDEKEENRKRFWKLTEKAEGREAIVANLADTVRSHYDSLERIADDVEELGYKDASAILRERLPRGKKARSGDLGEILASELTEEQLGFAVPVRRMCFKDGREVASRGDDFIGISYDEERDRLRLLKGESKSRKTLGKATITAARKALDRDDGRCTPVSLLFVADRLMDRGGVEESLGKIIRREVAKKTLPPSRIDHVRFTLSGNAPPEALAEDFAALDQKRSQLVVNFRIEVARFRDFVEAVLAALPVRLRVKRKGHVPIIDTFIRASREAAKEALDAPEVYRQLGLLDERRWQHGAAESVAVDIGRTA